MIEQAPSYYDYARGVRNPSHAAEAASPEDTAQLQLPEPEPTAGIEVIEERFDSMTGLFRRVGEILAKDRR